MTAEPSTADLAQLVLAGNQRAIARVATLIEFGNSASRDVMKRIFSATGRAPIVGITGPPGVGKSTLVNQLVKVIRKARQSVGVIAVDPSSSFTQGAILGDRIRMQEHHADSGVFIRSMGTRGSLGGLASATLEVALLLDAAGCDLVIIETVGAGQDEVKIAGIADVTVLVLAPDFGDDMQIIKGGIMEIADIFAINKSDLKGTDNLVRQIKALQSLPSPFSTQHDHAQICRVTATDGGGVTDLLTTIQTLLNKHGKRSSQKQIWAIRLQEMLRDSVLASLPISEIEHHAELVASKSEDPYTALAALQELLVASSEFRTAAQEGSHGR